MLGEEVNCIVDILNEGTDVSKNPKYLVAYRAEEGKLYDVLSDDYNHPRLSEQFALCSKRSYNEPAQIYKPQTENVTNTIQVLQYYIENFMQNPNQMIFSVSESNQNIVNVLMWISFIICALIIIPVTLVFWK
ncbi:5'_nucleotidase family protein [Hexamita inflata]|uniref:5' nucleotidase family protein n=1 Tax=Hexamita inflata TaxID=28002 RepID=A0AA86UIU0_9EUKA|nr:5' nucleotidase family protein [Hexamita inflata]